MVLGCHFPRDALQNAHLCEKALRSVPLELWSPLKKLKLLFGPLLMLFSHRTKQNANEHFQTPKPPSFDACLCNWGGGLSVDFDPDNKSYVCTIKVTHTVNRRIKFSEYH